MSHRPDRPLVSPQGILTFTALSQIVLYLWVTGRITGAIAASALTGVFLFGLLVRAVREVLEDQVADVDSGPVADWQGRAPEAAHARALVERPPARPTACAARR